MKTKSCDPKRGKPLRLFYSCLFYTIQTVENRCGLIKILPLGKLFPLTASTKEGILFQKVGAGCCPRPGSTPYLVAVE